MAGELEIQFFGQSVDASFQFWVFFKGGNFSALHTGGVVVVPGKGFAEFQLVLPANLQTINHTKFLKKVDCPINTCPVHFVLQFTRQLTHAQGVTVCQSVKYLLPGFGQAVTVLFENDCNSGNFSRHDAILAHIATILQCTLLC